MRIALLTLILGFDLWSAIPINIKGTLAGEVTAPAATCKVSLAQAGLQGSPGPDGQFTLSGSSTVSGPTGFAETRNLAADEPAKAAELNKLWDDYQLAKDFRLNDNGMSPDYKPY